MGFKTEIDRYLQKIAFYFLHIFENLLFFERLHLKFAKILL